MASAKVIAEILGELDGCLGSLTDEHLDEIVETLADAPRIFCAGAGRSALVVRGFAMRLAHLGKTVFVVGETTTPPVGPDDLLLIASGSGRTESIRAIAQKAQDLGAGIMLFTINADSPVGELTNCIVELPAPSPKVSFATEGIRSVQPMGTLFEQSLGILFDALIVLLMRREGVTPEKMFARHANLE